MSIRKPFRSKSLGIAIIGIAIVAGLAARTIAHHISGPESIALIIVLSAAAWWIISLGRRVASPDAESIINDPSHNIVLYLRPFSADGESSTWSELNYEQELSYCLSGIGKLVAMGRPSESLATLGAARTYHSEDEWQDYVLTLISRARLIVVYPGVNAGIDWELRQTLAKKALKDILFFLPHGVSKLSATASSIGLSPEQFPNCNFGRAKFAWFNDQGVIEPLGVSGPSWWAKAQKYLNKWTEAPVFLEALRPVLARYGARPSFQMQAMHYLMYVVTAAFIAFVVWLIYWLLAGN